MSKAMRPAKLLPRMHRDWSTIIGVFMRAEWVETEEFVPQDHGKEGTKERISPKYSTWGRRITKIR
jgi:hypothetical protein